MNKAGETFYSLLLKASGSRKSFDKVCSVRSFIFLGYLALQTHRNSLFGYLVERFQLECLGLGFKSIRKTGDCYGMHRASNKVHFDTAFSLLPDSISLQPKNRVVLSM